MQPGLRSLKAMGHDLYLFKYKIPHTFFFIGFAVITNCCGQKDLDQENIKKSVLTFLNGISGQPKILAIPLMFMELREKMERQGLRSLHILGVLILFRLLETNLFKVS